MSNLKQFLPFVRALSVCFQQFESYSNQHFRELDLTPAQFDIIATLGNTSGMTCKQLGDKTLITKGTLTGVLDRLIDKGFVSKQSCTEDNRVIYVKLTKSGEELFEKVFEAHLQHLNKVFSHVEKSELDASVLTLNKISELFKSNKGT